MLAATLLALAVIPSPPYPCDLAPLERMTSMFPDREVRWGEERIIPKKPFATSSKIECLGDVEGVITGLRRETGTTQSGREYRVSYNDGSGAVVVKAGELVWSMQCREDIIKDEVSCSASDGNVFVGYSSVLGAFVGVGHNHTPGTQVHLRIGKGTPFTAAEDRSLFIEKQARSIFTQVAQQGEIRYSYVEWPNRASRQGIVSTAGFLDAAALTEWAVKNWKVR